MCRDIEDSEEFRLLQSLPFPQDFMESKKLALTKRYYYQHLDSQYKFKGDNPDFQDSLQDYFLPIGKEIGNTQEDDVLPF